MKISIKYPGNLLTKPVLKELLSFKKCSHNNLAVARIFSKPLGFEKATKSQSILRMKFLKSPSTSEVILKSRDFKRLKISQIFSILKSRDFKRLKISQIFSILKSRDFKRLKISQIFSILKSRDFKRLKISQIFSIFPLCVSASPCEDNKKEKTLRKERKSKPLKI